MSLLLSALDKQQQTSDTAQRDAVRAVVGNASRGAGSRRRLVFAALGVLGLLGLLAVFAANPLLRQFAATLPFFAPPDAVTVVADTPLPSQPVTEAGAAPAPATAATPAQSTPEASPAAAPAAPLNGAATTTPPPAPPRPTRVAAAERSAPPPARLRAAPPGPPEDPSPAPQTLPAAPVPDVSASATAASGPAAGSARPLTPLVEQRLVDPLAAAHAAEARGDLAAAVLHYAAAAELQPSDMTVLFGWAGALVRRADNVGAAQVYERILSLDAHNPDALAALATLHQEVDPVGWRSRLVLAIERHPRHAGLRAALGTVLAVRREWAAAAQAWAQAAALDPQPDYFYNQGVCLDRAGQSRAALAAYRAALAAAGRTPANFDATMVAARITELKAVP